MTLPNKSTRVNKGGFEAPKTESLEKKTLEIKESIAALKERLNEMQKTLDNLLLEEFYALTPYRKGDIVEVGLLIHGKAQVVEARLSVCNHDTGWKFLAYPRRKDGAFSEKYYILWDGGASIVKLVSDEFREDD